MSCQYYRRAALSRAISRHNPHRVLSRCLHSRRSCLPAADGAQGGSSREIFWSLDSSGAFYGAVLELWGSSLRFFTICNNLLGKGKVESTADCRWRSQLEEALGDTDLSRPPLKGWGDVSTQSHRIYSQPRGAIIVNLGYSLIGICGVV